MIELDPITLTKRLVAIPSVSGDESAITDFVATELADRGWQVSTQEVAPDEPKTAMPTRRNVLARDPTTEPDLLLTTHLDTVPPHIALTEDDTHLYGRGVCDAKGIFAAQWSAAEALRASGLKNVGLLALVGEETRSLGAKQAKALVGSVRFLIVGEPTELLLASAAQGVLLIHLSATGSGGHSAYPERGSSAAHELIAGLSRLIDATLPAEPAFGTTTVNVGLLRSGDAPNVLAPHGHVEVMIRLAAKGEVVLKEVRRILGQKIDCVVKSQCDPYPIYVPEGQPSALVRFGSDVPYLREIGTPLLLGPGSIHDAHMPHEKIEKAAITKAVAVYEQLARVLLD